MKTIDVLFCLMLSLTLAAVIVQCNSASSDRPRVEHVPR